MKKTLKVVVEEVLRRNEEQRKARLAKPRIKRPESRSQRLQELLESKGLVSPELLPIDANHANLTNSNYLNTKS